MNEQEYLVERRWTTLNKGEARVERERETQLVKLIGARWLWWIEDPSTPLPSPYTYLFFLFRHG